MQISTDINIQKTSKEFQDKTTSQNSKDNITTSDTNKKNQLKSCLSAIKTANRSQTSVRFMVDTATEVYNEASSQ